MDIASWLGIIASVLKFFMLIYQKTQKTKAEERRAALQELDVALEKAKASGDLRELSKWIGKKL
jgi:hypothetical protein